MDEIEDEDEEEVKDDGPKATTKTGTQKAFFILGGPASGKGTYCTALNKEHSIPHFSTGDLLRKEIASGSKLADQINDVIK
jgi:cytidylate kinase